MRYLSFLVLAMTFVWAEPSVYDGSKSYSSAKKNRNAILSLKEDVAQLRQEIEGLKSIVEGLSISLNEQRQKSASSGQRSDSKLIEDLGAMIDRINRNYVSKVELQKALKSGKIVSKKPAKPKTEERAKDKEKPAEKRAPKSTKSKLETASSSALYSRGVRLVKKKKYSMAKLRFDILKKRGYKKASTYYYLGEIAYRTKHYSDAIGHYKISAQTNENANYMDTLLLHTGIALEKKGDKSQAKRFFQAIIDGYPDTGSAKVAKKHL